MALAAANSASVSMPASKNPMICFSEAARAPAPTPGAGGAAAACSIGGCGWRPGPWVNLLGRLAVDLAVNLDVCSWQGSGSDIRIAPLPDFEELPKCSQGNTVRQAKRESFVARGHPARHRGHRSGGASSRGSPWAT